MDCKGWTKVVNDIGPFSDELDDFGIAIKDTLHKLLLECIELSELRYYGYKDLSTNADKPELLASIKARHSVIINEKEKVVNELENSLSELKFLMDDFVQGCLEYSRLTVPENYIPED